MGYIICFADKLLHSESCFEDVQELWKVVLQNEMLSHRKWYNLWSAGVSSKVFQ